MRDYKMNKMIMVALLAGVFCGGPLWANEAMSTPTPGDRFNQFYDDEPLTPDFDYTATTISFHAASSEIRDSANGFGRLSKGDFIYTSGAARDGNRAGWKITSKVNRGRLKISATNNSDVVTNERAGRAVRVLQGLSQNDVRRHFFGRLNVGNPSFQRVIADPDIPGGKIIEQIAPKNEFHNAETGVHFFAPLDKINARAREVYFGFWVKFLPGKSGGFLQSRLSSGDSTSFRIENIFGDIGDIPVVNKFPDGRDRVYAGELILGDPDDVHEVITYQRRSGSGPSYTILRSLQRGFRGTRARTWPAGTKVTIGYGWAKGHKLPGLIAGDRRSRGGREAVSGTHYASVRLYQLFDWRGTPARYGTPSLYRYDEFVERNSVVFGRSDTPRGYRGGLKEFSQNKWHALEMRVKMNTRGVANGEMSGWIDGEHVIEKKDIMWAGPNAQFDTWNFLYYATHWGGSNSSFNTSKEEIKHFDGFAIGLSRLNLFSAGRGAVGPATSSSNSEPSQFVHSQ